MGDLNIVEKIMLIIAMILICIAAILTTEYHLDPELEELKELLNVKN